jgi:hypothetical protein
MPVKQEATGAPHDRAQTGSQIFLIGEHVNGLRYGHKGALSTLQGLVG